MTTSIHSAESPAAARRQQPLAENVEFRVIVFILLHIPLAFVLDFSGWLGAIHALAVLLYGLRAAFRRQDSQVIAVLGYITGAEILWRMTEARILWEYGKYAAILLTFFAILAASRNPRRLSGSVYRLNPAIIFYLAFLLPSLILTFAEWELARARNEISFNLSGPLALTFLALYFWQRPLAKRELLYFLIALVAPIVGILTKAGWHTITADALEFSLNANFVTSGGYGPNQVSNILGLGALACVILLVLLWRRLPFRLFFSGLGALFLFQAILTFSRGGVYSFILAVTVFIFHLLRSPQARNRFAFLLITGLLLGWYVGNPLLNRITAAMWQTRFTSLDSTGRMELVLADWQAFLDHPLAGAGVGLSKQYHAEAVDSAVTAHTEFSRTLAEHGLLGVLSTLILLGLLVVSYVRNKRGLGRALAATFAIWSLSLMVHSGMRFVAISLGIALALAVWQVSLDDGIGGEA
jgi:O-antigen ligase